MAETITCAPSSLPGPELAQPPIVLPEEGPTTGSCETVGPTKARESLDHRGSPEAPDPPKAINADEQVGSLRAADQSGRATSRDSTADGPSQSDHPASRLTEMGGLPEQEQFHQRELQQLKSGQIARQRAGGRQALVAWAIDVLALAPGYLLWRDLSPSEWRAIRLQQQNSPREVTLPGRPPALLPALPVEEPTLQPSTSQDTARAEPVTASVQPPQDESLANTQVCPFVESAAVSVVIVSA